MTPSGSMFNGKGLEAASCGLALPKIYSSSLLSVFIFLSRSEVKTFLSCGWTTMVWVVIRHSILQAAISAGEKGLRCLNITMCQAYSKTTVTFVLVYHQNSIWQYNVYLDVHKSCILSNCGDWNKTFICIIQVFLLWHLNSDAQIFKFWVMPINLC